MQSAKDAKSYSVFEYGIGEELPFTLYGWVGEKLAAICQVPNRYSDKMLRFQAVAEVTTVLRRAWGITAVTFMAEGFCSLDDAAVDRSTPLPLQFAGGNDAVVECLTFMHVEFDDMIIFASPYKYGLGRIVSFGKTKKYPRANDSAYAFPSRLQDILQREPWHDTPEDSASYFEAVADGLGDMGIECEWWNIY